jgi:hypothetical protein
MGISTFLFKETFSQFSDKGFITFCVKCKESISINHPYLTEIGNCYTAINFGNYYTAIDIDELFSHSEMIYNWVIEGMKTEIYINTMYDFNSMTNIELDFLRCMANSKSICELDIKLKLIGY